MYGFQIALLQDNQGGGGMSSLLGLVVAVVMLGSMWRIFTKAGKPGWAAIIPIYNMYTLLQVVGKPVWWLILFLIPLVNFVTLILIWLSLAKSFGKSVLFGVGLILLPFVFLPLLAFSDASYIGPDGNRLSPAVA